MKTYNIELPAEFRSGNSVPVERATITRERMTEILQDALEADRKRIANAISDRYDNVEAGNVNRDPYHSGMATAYDIAEQIVLGEMEK